MTQPSSTDIDQQELEAAKGFTPAVLANMPTAQLLNTPPPAPPAETVDMEAFKEACANWSK